MTVLLDPSLPFEELLEAVAKKFKDSAKFWGAVQMTLTLEGRTLTPAQELAVVNTIKIGRASCRERVCQYV